MLHQRIAIGSIGKMPSLSSSGSAAIPNATQALSQSFGRPSTSVSVKTQLPPEDNHRRYRQYRHCHHPGQPPSLKQHRCYRSHSGGHRVSIDERPMRPTDNHRRYPRCRHYHHRHLPPSLSNTGCRSHSGGHRHRYRCSVPMATNG